MSTFVYVNSDAAHHHKTIKYNTSVSLFPRLFFSPLPDFFLPLSLLSLPVISGMTGNYLLTNPLLRTHDTNPYNNLLAETVVCNTPSPPAFHSPGARPPSTRTMPRFVFVVAQKNVWHFGKHTEWKCGCLCLSVCGLIYDEKLIRLAIKLETAVLTAQIGKKNEMSTSKVNQVNFTYWNWKIKSFLLPYG